MRRLFLGCCCWSDGEEYGGEGGALEPAEDQPDLLHQ